jgi:hypothetical protein
VKKLLDVVIDVLKRPDAENRLLGDNLQDLREAILTRDENDLLQQKLDRGFGHCCFECRRVLRHREMATMADGVLFCTRCMEPQCVACGDTTCQNTMGLPKSVVKFLRSLKKCERHEGEISAERPAVNPSPSVISASLNSADFWRLATEMTAPSYTFDIETPYPTPFNDDSE